MKREHTIPLFLWIALALCVHAITGGGANRASEWFAERLDVRDFARDARGLARRAAPDLAIDIETSLPEDDALPEDEPETKEVEKSEPEKDPEAIALKEPEPEPEKKPPEPPKPPEAEKKKKEIQLTEKKPVPAEPPKVEPPPVIVPDRRIAVKQHADKPDQEDNPNARFAAEEANRVEKETQARITARDQNEKIPDPGKGPSIGAGDPGNSEESRIAESEERKGETGATETAQASRPSERAGAVPQEPPGSRTPEAQREAKARAASEAEKAQSGAPEVVSSEAGRDAVEKSREARAGREGQKALPSLKPRKPTDLLGLGSEARTARGINLNLSPMLANSIVGADNLAQLSKKQSEKRLSQHRGPWKSLGLERWRASIENYVPVVQPGNQTALNTARVPFANYLHEIHNKIHPIFADTFLAHLSTLPPNHPLNNMDMSTHLEIALNREDGSVVRMGITKTSGVTMFDVGALDSVKRASPFGKPPGMIVSGDGNVYFHWEFHRRPEFACSTYYARPFLLNLPQPDAPSTPTPSPTAPTAPDEKHTLFPSLSPPRPRG